MKNHIVSAIKTLSNLSGTELAQFVKETDDNELEGLLTAITEAREALEKLETKTIRSIEANMWVYMEAGSFIGMGMGA
jgi:hypothetical protein